MPALEGVGTEGILMVISLQTCFDECILNVTIALSQCEAIDMLPHHFITRRCEGSANKILVTRARL